MTYDICIVFKEQQIFKEDTSRETRVYDYTVYSLDNYEIIA
jgi:hypothetical protein